jgi:hypothetical protein
VHISSQRRKPLSSSFATPNALLSSQAKGCTKIVGRAFAHLIQDALAVDAYEFRQQSGGQPHATLPRDQQHDLGGGLSPLCASVFCRVHLRPAATKAGVVIPDRHRRGLHNLRHSLSNWLVNKAKENPKTVQGILL